MLFSNMDRLQLYILHDRNYSDSSLMFLTKIYNLKENENELV